MQYYLLKPIDDICKKYIARFRMSSHCLNIEHGRYRNECEKIDYVLSVTKMILRMNFILFLNVLSIAT